MRCLECGGTGAYHGLQNVEICIACRGTGFVKVPDHLPTDDEMGIAAQRPMIPMIGECIYHIIQEAEGKIIYVDDDIELFEAEFSAGKAFGIFKDLVWNVSLERWEVDKLLLR